MGMRWPVAARLAVAALAACTLSACGHGGGAVVAGGGTFEILAVGGEGTATEDNPETKNGEGFGGDGGRITILGTTGSDIEILRGGSVDAAVPPPQLKPSLGTNPLIIAADRTLGPADLALGFLAGSFDPSSPATGLLVKRGATLAVQPGVSLAFQNGVVIEGTVRGGGRTNVFLQADDVLITETGRIDTSGLDEASGAESGGDGGQISMFIRASILSRGVIDASGGDGVNGGRGQNVVLLSNAGIIHNSGTINASGGIGRLGIGGGAPMGGVVLSSSQGAVFNTGDILARGGAGRDGGGVGERIELSAGSGAVASAGTLDASGGGGGGSQGIGGGRAGGLFLSAAGGTAKVSGKLIARGGDGTGTGNGGTGGTVSIGSRPGTSPLGGTSLVGGIFIGADIDTGGGRGSNGGQAGPIMIGGGAGSAPFAPVSPQGTVAREINGFSQGAFVPGEAPIVLAGYRRIDVSGGRGVVRGGNAASRGRASLFFPDPGVLVENVTVTLEGVGTFAGGIHNEVDWIGRGGEATAGDGGMGAGLQFIAGAGQRDGGCRTVENRGSLDLRGGSGTRLGGAGRHAVLFDHLQVESHGPIDVSGGYEGGGAPAAQASGGGGGGAVVLASDDVVLSFAPLKADGGEGDSANGGRGGLAFLSGRSVRSAGDLSCRGGDGVFGGAGGTFAGSQPVTQECGDGFAGSCEGGIFIFATERPSEVSGVLGVRGGRGEPTAGPDGRIVIDGIDLPLIDGEVRF